MARVHLDLPHDFAFATDIRLRVTDINCAGHLGNDMLLSLLQEARSRFFASHGLDPMGRSIFGAGHVIADAAIVYQSEAFAGETLTIEVTVGDFNNYGCDVFYRVREKSTGREVARAKTGLVFFDYESRRVRTMPPDFLALFTQGGVVV